MLSLSFQAIWENQFYYLFGFLFLVFIILIIACSEVAIVMTYFQLCGEDYHWWWRSFTLSGSCSFYVLAYSIIYYYTKVSGEVPSLFLRKPFTSLAAVKPPLRDDPLCKGSSMPAPYKLLVSKLLSQGFIRGILKDMFAT
jgi:hypothetical protein